jgi:hypothetical protein
MKGIMIIVLLLALLSSCKKKENSSASSPPKPIKSPPPSPDLSVKINGSIAKTLNSYPYIGMSENSKQWGVTFCISTKEKMDIRFFTPPAIGSYTFAYYSKPYVSYINDNVFFNSVIGKLTITELDTTSSGMIKKMIGTFYCKTDTMLNPWYNLTEGSINVIK